ncbi:anti-sigma factor family protein [Nitriliruptor alkaliphilus]|uniref:anti-sigma factor family protein n=1 Tax=Nitriliruptor alkaliphilus TaxID=427918 RepID=UPI0006983D48|nr:hypothetical protein [Nitriliruptor alkaliphilus]
MEPAERLAAFLAGELSADEHQAVEAELARDAALRAELAAIRRADEALAAEAPTALPEGARERLIATLSATFDAELGPAATGTAATTGTDELATRRRAAAARRSWMVGLGGVAAAIAAIAVIGPTLGGLGAGDDAATMAGPESAGDAAFDEADDAAPAPFAAPVGPTLRGGDRALDEDGAAALLAAGELEALVDQDLSVEDAAALGDSWAQAFGAGTLYSASPLELDGEELSELSAADDGEDAAVAESEDEDLDQRLHATTRSGGPLGRESAAADLQLLDDVSEDDREDVGRCLDTLLAGGGVIVPVLAELVTFQGEPAIAFVLATVAPDDTVTRREVWVLARESCEVRYLRQG